MRQRVSTAERPVYYKDPYFDTFPVPSLSACASPRLGFPFSRDVSVGASACVLIHI